MVEISPQKNNSCLVWLIGMVDSLEFNDVMQEVRGAMVSAICAPICTHFKMFLLKRVPVMLDSI